MSSLCKFDGLLAGTPGVCRYSVDIIRVLNWGHLLLKEEMMTSSSNNSFNPINIYNSEHAQNK